MKKTKHFNISVPELGDVPDITQVSNAISDLEDATAGTLEIMKAEMQGTKITLTSVSRKTKRTGYYEGMSIRFKSPQDIEPNYLKTISVDGLGDQTLSVEYKVNRNEYIDIVYEGNKFTAYPVVVQKTDSVSENSSILVGTAKGVKTAYDKGVDALNKANQAQSSANHAQSTADGKVSKSGDTMTGNIHNYNDSTLEGVMQFTRGGGLPLQNYVGAIQANWFDDVAKFGIVRGNSTELSTSSLKFTLNSKVYDIYHTGYWDNKLNTNSKLVSGAINELNSGKENKINKKSGFNLDKSDSVTSNSSNTIATSSAIKTAYDKASQAQSTADEKVSKSGDTLTGALNFTTASGKVLSIDTPTGKGTIYTDSHHGHGIAIQNTSTKNFLFMGDNGETLIDAKNLNTSKKEIVAAINELNSKIASHCPYTVGDIYITTRSENPSTIWLGTTWDKIEGRFLLGTSGGAGAGATGGSMSKTLSVANMPTHSHSASQSAHSHTQPAHTHPVNFTFGDGWGQGNGLSRRSPGETKGTYNTNAAGGETTGSAQPSINIGNAGSGSAFDITPSYYTVHIWKRRG